MSLISGHHNDNNNWGVSISTGIHLCLLLYFFLTYIDNIQPSEQREGLLVAIGDFTETSVGEEALGNIQTPVDEQVPSAPTKPQSNEVDNKNTSITSDEKQSVKASTPKKTETAIGKPANNPSTANETGTGNKEALNQKKQQFGSLFGKGQGTKEGSGNQGDPNGGPDSKILEGISKGRGTIGGGLNGRKVIQAPTISENSQKSGKVAVKVCVDKNGKVVTANFTQKGSSTTDAQLVRFAEKGAMKYVFASGELDSQCGTITFDFKLN